MQKFKLRDLVYAKISGYPPWPAIVILKINFMYSFLYAYTLSMNRLGKCKKKNRTDKIKYST